MDILQFFNSNFFTAIATLITGVFVITAYKWQQNLNKIQAARVLLTEIRIAEDRIIQIKDKIDSKNLQDLPPVFPTKSWKMYAHLFVSDFDQDELKLINSFYDYGELIEEFAKRNNDYFWANTEERARVTVQRLGQFIEEAFNNAGTVNPDEFVKQKRDFLSTGFDNYNLPYAPVKTTEGIKTYLSKIQNITVSSCGIKLKRLAKLVL